MKHDGLSMDQRRAHLAGEIARQRGEFATAYKNLSTPIHYTEQAMRGFGFLRQNPWVLSVVPAVFTIGSALLGLKKAAAPTKVSSAERRRLAELERKEAKGWGGKLIKYGGHGWKIFKLYRRVKPFIS